MKKALLSLLAGALVMVGCGVAKADTNITLVSPENGQTYDVIKRVTVDVTNEDGVYARVRWGTETGVYPNSETFNVVQGENVLDLVTRITDEGTYFLKVELQDVSYGKIGDTGEVTFDIVIPPAPAPSMFTIPEGGMASILLPTGNLISDGWVIIAIVIGVPLAFFVIERLIAIIKKRK